MKKFFAAGVFAIAALFATGIYAQENQNPDATPSEATEASTNEVIEAFLSHVEGLDSISADQKTAIASQVKELAADPYSLADAITVGLGTIYPEYKAAVETSFTDEESKSIDLLKPLADSDDKFLAADASFYLARVMMNLEQYDTALPLLEKLGTDLSGSTIHGNSAIFFTGVAQAGLLKNKEAIATFTKFLKEAGDAPERLRVSAWRQIQQLQMIREGQLEDVHQRMIFSENRLKQSKSGDVTQEQQDKIANMLKKLIKEQEKKECSNCKSNCNKPGQKQAKKPSKGQGKSPSQGKSSQGGSSNNPNGVVRREFDNGPASPWSRLRDRSRDAANTAIKEKLPAKYREIVEKYSAKARGDEDK